MNHSKRLLPALAVGLFFAMYTPAFAVDNDGDGVEAELGDCDDGNSSIYPGAVEITGNEVDEDCDAHEQCFVDGDNDVYRTSATVLSTDVDCADAGEARSADPTGDCDDSDPDINPGAAEVCDIGDVDEDCDGLADDNDSAATGTTSWYEDADVDGYGAGPAVLACDAPTGTVADATDCDDSDAGIHPFGVEVCDAGGKDEDCDGLVDDADSGATGQTLWYEDADSDGYGDPAANVLACDAPTGTVADATDCDDTASNVNPGKPEICDIGDVDDDCDGMVDDNDIDATGKTSWYEDADSDGYGGTGGASTVACDAPTGTVGNDGDCDDTDSAISPGAPEVCDGGGVDEDCDNTVDCDDAACSSEPSCVGTVEVFDHLECFKIKTTEKFKATLDLDPGINPPFPVAAGCTIGKATKYCVPVMRKVAVVDDSSTLTGGSATVGQDLTDDRICYKVTCPDTDTTSITITGVDRFGNREFTKMKYSEICTPASQAP